METFSGPKEYLEVAKAMALTREELRDLLTQIEHPRRVLDWCIALLLCPEKCSGNEEIPCFTTDLQAARSLVPPDWFFTVGLCALTGHTTIGPDYNGPAGERLYRDFPQAQWHYGISYDLPPGGDDHRACMALCCACLDVPDLTVPGPYHRIKHAEDDSDHKKKIVRLWDYPDLGLRIDCADGVYTLRPLLVGGDRVYCASAEFGDVSARLRAFRLAHDWAWGVVLAGLPQQRSALCEGQIRPDDIIDRHTLVNAVAAARGGVSLSRNDREWIASTGESLYLGNALKVALHDTCDLITSGVD